MPEEPEFLSAAHLDPMTPDQRMAAFEARLVTDLDALPDDFRDQIIASVDRLTAERHPPARGAAADPSE